MLRKFQSLLVMIGLALTLPVWSLAGEARAENPLLHPEKAKLEAPAVFKVDVETSKGHFTMEVHRDWAPVGADRFYNLVKLGFYDDAFFFRVVRTPRPFMAQVGFNADPAVTAAWREATIVDDPVKQANTRGMVSFAKTNAPNSRTTQFFINYADNKYLDGYGFAPFAKIVSGMDIVDSLYSGYGEGAPQGHGPSQARIAREGNSYLKKEFPKLDRIIGMKIVEDGAKPVPGGKTP